MKPISDLPAPERAKRYRQLEREARVKASACMGEIQQSFIKLASDCNQLALEAEDEAKADGS